MSYPATFLTAASVLVLATMSCADVPGDGASAEASEAAYREALGAVFDTLRWTPARLVFADRFVMLGSFTDTEAGPRDLFDALARGYPGSRVCSYEECTPSDGETLVFVSRISRPDHETARLAVLTYIHQEGNVFGDGWRLELGYRDGRWALADLAQVAVPE